MKKKIKQIYTDFNDCKIDASQVPECLLYLRSVMLSSNIDIRRKAQKYLSKYYGSNDSRATEKCHIDHYIQGYKKAEKEIINTLKYCLLG